MKILALALLAAASLSAQATYSGKHLHELIGNLPKKGILILDREYQTISNGNAKRALEKARFDLSKRGAVYTETQWDCEDFARYGVNEVKLKYLKTDSNPAVGTITYKRDGGQLHARTFVLVDDDNGLRIFTYEMTRSVRYKVDFEQLSATEMQNIQWIIM